MEQQPVKRIKWMQMLTIACWAVLGLSSIALLVASADSSDSRVCQSVRVQIASESLDTAQFGEELYQHARMLNGKPFEGAVLETMRLSWLELQLKKDPWLNDAQLYVDNDAMLHIRVSTENPCVRLYDTSFQSYYATQDGLMLPFKNGYAMRLPVVTGMPFGYGPVKSSDSTFLNEIARLCHFIQKDSFWMALIDQVHVTTNRSIELIPKVGGLVVEFGDLHNVEAKFQKLHAFYKHAAATKKWGVYSKVMLQFREQVVAVLRDQQELVADSAETIRIMQQVAIKARLLSTDTSLQKQTEQTDQSTNESMITQSVERDIPAENSTNVPPSLPSTPVNTIPQKAPLKPATSVPVKTTVPTGVTQSNQAAVLPATRKPNPVTVIKPAVVTTPKAKPVTPDKPAAPSAVKPVNTKAVTKPPPKQSTPIKKPPATPNNTATEQTPNNDY
ncbi:MAG: hypothetical protein ACKO5C_04990 [Ferruginibacter sp.]